MLKQHLIKDLIWEGKRAKITFYSIDDMWFFMINTDIDIHNNEQSIRQITASVVHDFRNILTVLKGYSDLMLEDPQSMYITKMQETITRSTEMINKLLRFTRSDEIIYTKIYDVLLNMKDVLIRLLGKQITLKLEIKENIAYIGLSTIDLERIITNMAINAKEAMNETGILKITLYKKYFETNWILNETILRAGFYAVLQFEDTGCGISEEEIDNIFSPFYTTKPNGNGIGLSTIVSMLKEVSGGIKCQSKLNIGTKFDLYFPIIQGTNIASPVRLKQQANTDCAKSIILVEDTHDIREILEISLKKAGYIVYSFGTAEEAIDCISTLIEIDLIITDANLPGKSGACIVSAGRKKKPSLQTIVISGFDRNRLFQMFPNDSIFISKPIHVGNFIATVNQILQNKENDDS
jgi:two-component system cell cycle sensor histidine kinase/response regulator CckA